MRPVKLTTALLIALAFAAPAAETAEPDYKLWQDLLSKHYDPARGMDYKGLRQDKPMLDRLRQQMATVDAGALSRREQLAYWINLYNISVVGVVADNYPVESIRDISTDPIVRLNVFKKPYVQVRGGTISLDEVENQKIREAFKDPRIHFAINCAAESCPPIRPEPFMGARIDQQLDDQARKFLNGPHGVRLEPDGDELTLHVTKILDWFKDDFETWGGGTLPFLRKYLTPDKVKRIDAAQGKVDLELDEYSWKLNDWGR
jgi:Protein of unknown function, DUF547